MHKKHSTKSCSPTAILPSLYHFWCSQISWCVYPSCLTWKFINCPQDLSFWARITLELLGSTFSSQLPGHRSLPEPDPALDSFSSLEPLGAPRKPAVFTYHKTVLQNTKYRLHSAPQASFSHLAKAGLRQNPSFKLFLGNPNFVAFVLHEHHVPSPLPSGDRKQKTFGDNAIMCGKVKIAEISHERSKYLLLLNLRHVYVQWE